MGENASEMNQLAKTQNGEEGGGTFQGRQLAETQSVSHEDDFSKGSVECSTWRDSSPCSNTEGRHSFFETQTCVAYHSFEKAFARGRTQSRQNKKRAHNVIGESSVCCCTFVNKATCLAICSRHIENKSTHLAGGFVKRGESKRHPPQDSQGSPYRSPS